MKPEIIAILALFKILAPALHSAIGSDAAVDIFRVPEQYATVQAAIDAAQDDGSIIFIAPGDYYEQLLITEKNGLTLAGEPGAVLHATTEMAQTLLPANTLRPLLGIVRSDVTLTGLTFAGDQMGSVYSSGALQGLFLVGSSARVENCVFRDFRGSTLTEYSNARALVVWNPVTFRGPAQVNAVISSNIFQGNEVPIVIGGDDGANPTLLRTRFTVEGNTIIGFGPVEIALDGITIYAGASGIVRGNTISNFQYSGPGTFPYSSGITAHDGSARWRTPPRAFPLKELQFEANTLIDNDEHLVVLGAHGAQVTNNVFSGSGPATPRWGGVAISGTNVVIANNNFANMPTGIFLFANDQFFDNWPAVGIAHNAKLTANWFSNVTERVRVPDGLTGLKDEGSVLEPFRPTFQSIRGENNSVKLVVRGWHNQVVSIESSSDFRTWAPVRTTQAARPVTELAEPISEGRAARFYRVRVP